jgi:hypothetical protein
MAETLNSDIETQETGTETTTTTEKEVVNTAEKEVTLDDVYRDAGLDKIETKPAARETQQTQQTETQEKPSSVPDPYDSENFKAYMARQAAGTTELTQAVRAMAQHLGAEAQSRAVATTKADIEQAVSTVNEVVGHPKPKVIEAAIDGMVRDDPRLKAIWDNRGKNPTAWGNALKIVSKQIAEDFSVKVDQTLVASQRARKDSQRQMATTTRDEHSSPAEERLAKAQGQDFDAEWQRLKGGQ